MNIVIFLEGTYIIGYFINMTILTVEHHFVKLSLKGHF